MGILIVVLVVVILVAAIWDSQPKNEAKRQDAFIRSMGIDPNSYQGQLIKAQAASAQLGEKLKDIHKKEETRQIVKGAVVGGIIAGDAGAVVGAVTAKNKIDSKKQ